MEPPTDRLTLTERPGPAGEDKKRHLENVFRILPVMQNATTNVENHWAMPPDEGGEGGLVVVGDEAREKLAVRHGTPARRGECLPEVLECLPQMVRRHARDAPPIRLEGYWASKTSMISKRFCSGAGGVDVVSRRK
jgi:hypothetical protein